MDRATLMRKTQQVQHRGSTSVFNFPVPVLPVAPFRARTSIGAIRQPRQTSYTQQLRPVSASRGLPSQRTRVAMMAATTEVHGLEVVINNEADDECTVITVEGKDQPHLLMTISGAFTSAGYTVVSANISSDDGRVLDVFRVQNAEQLKIPEEGFTKLKELILGMTGGSSRSGRPAIYGIVAAAEVARLKPLANISGEAAEEVQSLELIAAEMAQAAAQLVAREKEILALRALDAPDLRLLTAKETARQEAAAVLERKMSGMEALLVSRRSVWLEPEEEEPSRSKAGAAMMESMKPPRATLGSGPGAGNGHEILLQGFNWESWKHGWYKTLKSKVKELANAGFTSIWLPPPSDSVSEQGYLPRDLYELNCRYGSEAELRDLISTFHEHKIKVIADIVVNHRCANTQGPDGKWNKFGGRLAWDANAICNTNPAFGGKGKGKQGDDYAAAPNIDHTQEHIRADITNWMKYLRTSIGYDGWRFDYVRGYPGQFCKQYINETTPEMAFGEYWDSCEYTDGVLKYNQDAHRQRTINWCDQTGGTAAAFDFTTKGILQEALSKHEYWRLSDSQGRPPGVIGLWPSRGITFIDNHDTGSTLNHWPFPSSHLNEGYAYILTHPGTPCVFWDHLYQEKDGLRTNVLALVDLRRKHGLTSRSKVVVRKAVAECYAATIDDKLAMKIGSGDWSPAGLKLQGREPKLALSGPNFAVWEAS